MLGAANRRRLDMETYNGYPIKGTPNTVVQGGESHRNGYYDANGDLKMLGARLIGRGDPNAWSPDPVQFRANPDSTGDPYKDGALFFDQPDGKIYVYKTGVGLVLADQNIIRAVIRSDGSVETAGVTPGGQWLNATEPGVIGVASAPPAPTPSVEGALTQILDLATAALKGGA
jgi:hypothetical protein